MKIIDENKLMGMPILLPIPKLENQLQNEKSLERKAEYQAKIEKLKTQIRIRIHKKIKVVSNGEKILLFKNKANKFRAERPISDDKKIEFNKFYEIWKLIVKQKLKKGEIEFIEFNDYDKKIKNLAPITKYVTEINSSDPRFILLWYYNPRIKINIWFKNKKVGIYSKLEFNEIFNNFDITQKKDWETFLSYFPVGKNKALLGFGWKKLIAKFNNQKEEVDYSRVKNIEPLIREMA